MQPGADDRQRFVRMRIDHFTDFLDGGIVNLAFDLAEIEARLRRQDAQGRGRGVLGHGALCLDRSRQRTRNR